MWCSIYQFIIRDLKIISIDIGLKELVTRCEAGKNTTPIAWPKHPVIQATIDPRYIRAVLRSITTYTHTHERERWKKSVWDKLKYNA